MRGNTENVFGVSVLLSIFFAPRIRDLGDPFIDARDTPLGGALALGRAHLSPIAPR